MIWARKKKKSHLASNIVLTVSVVVFVVAAFQLFRIGKGYQDGRKDYKELQENATKKKKDKKDGKEKFIVDFEKLAEKIRMSLGGSVLIRNRPLSIIRSYRVRIIRVSS